MVVASNREIDHRFQREAKGVHMMRLVPLLLWLILGYVQTAALIADWKVDVYSSPPTVQQLREDIAPNILFGFTIGIFVTPFVTGFYQHGFDWGWMRESSQREGSK